MSFSSCFQINHPGFLKISYRTLGSCDCWNLKPIIYWKVSHSFRKAFLWIWSPTLLWYSTNLAALLIFNFPTLKLCCLSLHFIIWLPILISTWRLYSFAAESAILWCLFKWELPSLSLDMRLPCKHCNWHAFSSWPLFYLCDPADRQSLQVHEYKWWAGISKLTSWTDTHFPGAQALFRAQQFWQRRMGTFILSCLWLTNI